MQNIEKHKAMHARKRNNCKTKKKQRETQKRADTYKMQKCTKVKKQMKAMQKGNTATNMQHIKNAITYKHSNVTDENKHRQATK